MDLHGRARFRAQRPARRPGRAGLLGLDAAVGDLAVLLVSELVTNSLRYASGPIGVRLARTYPDGEPLPADRPPAAPGLLVEVSDPLPDPPTERSAGPDDEGGRGLQLVACSARRWGPAAERAARPCGSSWLCLVRRVEEAQRSPEVGQNLAERD